MADGRKGRPGGTPANGFLLRALRLRGFRLYFAGQFVSFLGMWMRQVALMWLAYRVSGSAIVLGLVTFAAQVPSLLLAPLAGALADRLPRRGLLAATQLVELAVAGSLVWLASAGTPDGTVLVMLSLLLGIAVAIELPARQALLADMIPVQQELNNAIALNSVAFNVARLAGPALGALLLDAAGEAACFAFNAGGYAVEVITLILLRGVRPRPRHRAGALLHALAYLRRRAMPRALLVTLALSSVALAPFVTMLPVMVREVFGGDADTLGLLMAASGCGALLAGLALARHAEVTGYSPRVLAGCLAAGAVSLAFAANTHPIVAMLLMFGSGWATVMIVTPSHILLQSLVPDHLRGRCMAFFGMAYGGALSVAALAAGMATAVTGPRVLFVASGVLYLVTGMALRRRLPGLRAEARRILSRRGLLPPQPH